MRGMFKLALGAAAFVAAAIGALILWPIGNENRPITLAGDATRGAYLARAGGCIACHTDFAAGGAPLAGGVKLATPFGTLYSPNLTTDPEHGIGSWTVDQFARAVRQGISPEGAPYYPAFTYPFYANFSDQDIADLWAAFQTVPAVAEPSTPHKMLFPFNQRWGLKLWRAAFLEKPQSEPVPGNDAEWNRGRQIVGGAAHCAACHTGRNILGARKSDTQHFKGSTSLPGGGKAPAIDFETLQKRGWTVENLAFALKTGIRPDGDAFGGAMGEVVLYGTRFLTAEDRRAMAVYLMDDHSGG
ncbi:cytochrome c [Seohaeicola saemankumensis]|nr:cytochrome c [Seohaeicola saemankumensis]MCA0871412.1 cytochrome c [Seohaeicola saemankumensis]